MPNRRVFISFDFDHDEELRDALIAQAKNPDSPFEIVDYSVREPFESKWRDKVRSRIRRTDLTIVICGEHTHTAKGVAAEVTITQEERKPYFLLRGRPSKTCSKPASALRSDAIHAWTWRSLKQLLDPRHGP